MNALPVTLRPARPEDAWDVAPLVYASGPRELDFFLGDALAFLPFAFTRPSGPFSLNRYTVATFDERIVGVVALSRPEDAWRHDLELAFTLARFYGWTAPAVIARALQLEQIVPVPGRGTLFLSQLGVRADVRGRGVGTHLVRHALEVACATGARAVALDVAVTNDDAKRLYERLGFRVVRQRAWTGGGTVPSQRRMVCEVVREGRETRGRW